MGEGREYYSRWRDSIANSQRQGRAVSWITGCEGGRGKRKGPEGPEEAGFCAALSIMSLEGVEGGGM